MSASQNGQVKRINLSEWGVREIRRSMNGMSDPTLFVRRNVQWLSRPKQLALSTNDGNRDVTVVGIVATGKPENGSVAIAADQFDGQPLPLIVNRHALVAGERAWNVLLRASKTSPSA